jgi:chorismate mutase/prephenate dehydratase
MLRDFFVAERQFPPAAALFCNPDYGIVEGKAAAAEHAAQREDRAMNELEKARQTIDAVDAEMAACFERRMDAVKSVVAYKKEHDLPILDTGRESAVLEKNFARIQNETYRPYYADYLKYNMALSRQYQAAILGQDRAAYQGVEGAYAHIALKTLFPRSQAVSYLTWDAVFNAVEAGDAACGVVPFENSHAGDVSAVLDLCYNHKLFIQDMYDLSVSHCLLGVHGAQLSDIREVYSHQQAIAQSERFLKMLSLPAHPMENTAVAAKFVADSKDRTKAAIASAETAALYGLDVLARCINTDGDNTTRFIVIGKTCPADGNRFSILFTVDNKPGKLAQVIQKIGETGFNMECIKSRPMPHVPFEYYFYAELVGSPRDEGARALLDGLSQICRTVRLLGVYRK